MVADNWVKPRLLLGMLGVGMSVAAFMTALISSAWPAAAVFVVSLVYGATAVGWNGVYLAEVARIAPAGTRCRRDRRIAGHDLCGDHGAAALFWAIVASAAAMPPRSLLPPAC